MGVAPGLTWNWWSKSCGGEDWGAAGAVFGVAGGTGDAFCVAGDCFGVATSATGAGAEAFCGSKGTVHCVAVDGLADGAGAVASAEVLGSTAGAKADASGVSSDAAASVAGGSRTLDRSCFAAMSPGTVVACESVSAGSDFPMFVLAWVDLLGVGTGLMFAVESASLDVSALHMAAAGAACGCCGGLAKVAGGTGGLAALGFGTGHAGAGSRLLTAGGAGGDDGE